MKKSKTVRVLWPLWIYELALGFSGAFTGWYYSWLIVLTVLASITWTVNYKD